MDPARDSQLTQPTQTVVDPRRLGQQTSGFSDEDIADIICLLLPYSEPARQEVRRIAAENSQHMVGREDVDDLRLDYTREDESRNFPGIHSDVGENHIALRFSSQVKDPSQGFTFGRHPAFCDICLQNDPHRRLSKVHFRIYLNEHGVLMLEDMSTNGTVVDEVLLKKKDNPRSETMRTLESGSKIKILMHQAALDIVFLVRIPIRDGPCEEEYKRNLDAYLANQALFTADPGATIVPEPGGHVDIFKPRAPRPPAALGRNTTNAVTALRAQTADSRSRQSKSTRDALPRPWNGSNKYNRVCEIGRGAFATVHKVTMKFDGRPYAAKELDKRKFMKNGVLDQKVENEMRIMQRVKHPNIVEYIEHIDWDDRLLIIIMEFVGGGDLGKLIADNGPLSESGTKTMARQLLDALGYLHDMNITHRDVKPDNILVSSQAPFVVKLTDFGLSKMVDNEQTFLRTFCGTLLYCAPEVYSEYAEYDDHGRRHPRNRYRRPNTGQRYDHAVDIWSLGGVLFYALTKKPPFPARNGASHSELLHQIMTKPLDVSPLVEANVSDEGIDFICRMLDRRPETRATVEVLQNHPWISGSFTTVAQCSEQIAEEELHVNASQLSLEDTQRKQAECRELRVPSDDEISDDEDVDFDKDGLLSYESEKENYTFGPNHHPHRLFGEVNSSAVRSSGAIPADRLNLPISAASFGSNATTEILGNDLEIKDSFESEDSLTPRQKSQKSQASSGGLRASVLSAGQSRSVDELNNMTFDVASQSLGGAESILENLNMKSRGVSLLRSHTTGDLNTSKRKPSSDGSEEDEVPVTEDRRGLKRLRSETEARLAVDKAIENGEYELLAQMPSIMRAQSGRQIDNPVHKSTYWSAQDRKTWHLAYPEMTQLQLDAFKLAASARDEEFGPGKTPLWDLAMKYFPASNCERRRVDSGKPTQNGGAENGMIPSTAAPDASIPATPPDSDQGGIAELKMPMHSDPGRPVVACLQSAPGSAIPLVTILITESMVSWGRATENTRLYAVKNDLRVPKYAFRILLWKPHYDPAKNFRPWNRVPEVDEDLFHFYISTKATAGIYVNDVHLPSDDARNPSGPSKFWMTLYDGDRVSVWQTPDGRVKSELIFRCGWGGSAKQRATSVVPSSQSDFAPEAVAARLDEVCARAERKMRGLSEHDLKMEEANHDVEERMRSVDRERQRSREFEARRLEACRALGIRRVSPAPGVTLGEESATQTPWASYGTGGRTVPNFRHASPSTLELLRAARRG
ncbi:Pkinase-domain-containing protein [Parathielavia appendiculata]|uniref:Autophagy-related protein 1 n=1 Tax=Parathielavia appendiculata TaxID=2587402 RepID=A0AAN6Z7Z7_9PEZI|nr:Pkinase-domain-containing protein [Parathielavia appendiculata]